MGIVTDLFDQAPQAMWVFDAKTLRFLAVNEAAIERYGWSRDEFLAMTIRDIRPPEDQQALDVSLPFLQQPVISLRFVRHWRKDGSTLFVTIDSRELERDGRSARLVVATDVTEWVETANRLREEQRALAASEERLRQAAKMEAVGSLAGGVAHDFNNVIAVITSVTELMLEDPTLRPQQRADLCDVRQAAARASDLTRKLLAFSRSQSVQQQVLDLDAVVRDTEKMLRRLVREDIALETSLGAGGARVFADAGQLEQVLLNLVVNACDAMPGGGRIRVETSQVTLDKAVAARQPGARAGHHVLLSVSDTGSGMAPNVLARAFEPFFTTKQPGKGTGLGLAIVYGVVQQAGGFVRLSTEPGAGTTASVFLPR